MAIIIDIIKVAEDDKHVAYTYASSMENPGLIIVNKIDRDFFHAVRSSNQEISKSYFAARHKISKCFDDEVFPDNLVFAG